LILRHAKWPGLEKEETQLEFHLVYHGALPAAGQGSGKSRIKEKQELRKVFHKQLAMLWNTHPFLFDLKAVKPGQIVTDSGPMTDSYRISERYACCGYRFLPLISQFFMVSCSLDILFLRRDGPGSLIKSGGDIDNRLKVLFDGLRMPQTCDEVCGQVPAADENPFFCLLEDDKLISKVQVETNWLLTPPRPSEHINDVQLVIRVKTVMQASKKYQSAFQ
jgi:hypothetical protein